MTLPSTSTSYRYSTNGDRFVAPGSGKSNWVTANSDATAANTSSLLNPALSTGAATILPLTIPDGTTRVLLRASYLASVNTFTTSPVVRLYSVDANGVPNRIDTATSNGTGVTVTCSASMATEATATTRYSDVTTLTGYDCLCGSTLYALIETASSFAAQIQVLFEN